MNVVTFVYEGNGDRADVVISAELGITRSNAAKLIEEGNAKKGDATLKKITKLENDYNSVIQTKTNIFLKFQIGVKSPS